MELAKQNGWPDPRRELDAFKDYHLAHGTLMADWEAAFRTWLRNALAWGKSKPIQIQRAVKSPELKLVEKPRDHTVAKLIRELADKFDERKA
jgi:hypothetical protein